MTRAALVNAGLVSPVMGPSELSRLTPTARAENRVRRLALLTYLHEKHGLDSAELAEWRELKVAVQADRVAAICAGSR